MTMRSIGGNRFAGAIPFASIALAAILIVAMGSRAMGQSMADQGWQKIDAKDIADNPVTLFGKTWMALAAGGPEAMNAMTIGWGGLGTLWGLNNAAVTVYVEKTRYTHEYMDNNEYFTLTAFPEDCRDALLYLGSHSGRDEDKIAKSGLTAIFTENGNPAFAEGRLVLECRKIYHAPFDPEGMGERVKKTYSGDRPVHTIFIGEVVNVWVK